MVENIELNNDKELKLKFIELRSNGNSFKEISAELNVPTETLIKWAKELTLSISNQREVQLDALSNRYNLTKAKRIELMGNIVEQLQVELEKRDYSMLPLEKLFDYFLKYSAELKKEFEPPEFKQVITGMDPSGWETQVTWTG